MAVARFPGRAGVLVGDGIDGAICRGQPRLHSSAHCGKTRCPGVARRGNHHNFAWKERHIIDGVEREVVVHRKGATPAGEGVLGIIPGSMASPGFVVRGRGNNDSLHSASHGAGRMMSRKAAHEKFNWKEVNQFLRERGVTLISAGLDEVPMAYKNIREVMAAQQ